MHYVIGFAIGLFAGGTLTALYGAKVARKLKEELLKVEAEAADLRLKLRSKL